MQQMSEPDSSATDLGPKVAIEEFAGAGRAWLAVAMILACGIVGAGFAAGLSSSWEGLRSWACAGYGVAIGGIISVLPLFATLWVRGKALSRRPATDASDSPWWPLSLVASALRDTPALRRTAEDFHRSVEAFVPQARGLLGQRLWPACVAAFTAPVLGLVSAWVSWKFHLPEAMRRAQEAAREAKLDEAMPQVEWGVVAWPMIITIVLSLLLMLLIVLADQLTRRLLQRWASTVTPLDAESPSVAERLASVADGPLAVRGDRVSRSPEPAALRPAPISPPLERPQPQVSAEELQGLGEMFRNG
jgi:hypothetical protein